jgi:hypothetical protein
MQVFMEFEHFTLVRDLFYLVCIFFGAALGFILRHFSKRAPRRSRNRSLALAFCCLSAMTVFLALGLIISQVRVFTETPIYLTGAVIAVLLALGVRFPRFAGFPLILLAGAAIIWAGFSFLRYPISNPAVPVASYTHEDLGSNLEVVYTRLRAPYFYPLFGGETRGLFNYTKMRRIPGLMVDQKRITVPGASKSSGLISIYIEEDELVIR